MKMRYDEQDFFIRVVLNIIHDHATSLSHYALLVSLLRIFLSVLGYANDLRHSDSVESAESLGKEVKSAR